MAAQTRQEQLLECLVHVLARAAIPMETALKVVGDAKQKKAFNLCDGSRTMTEIAKEVGIDQGNFSRTVTRWVGEGVAFKLGEGRELRPLHVYPLPATEGSARRKGGQRSRRVRRRKRA